LLQKEMEKQGGKEGTQNGGRNGKKEKITMTLSDLYPHLDTFKKVGREGREGGREGGQEKRRGGMLSILG